MKKYLLTAGLLLALSATPVLAQSAPAADDLKQRQQLAEDFADIRPVRDMINFDIESVAQRLPETEREDFMRYIQLQMDYERIEALAVKTMADMFTVAELKAMIAYYSLPEAKSAEAKMGGYVAAVGPEVAKIIDSAVMNAKLGPGQ